MFGRRPDGRRVKNLDPIIEFTPYIMPLRNDAQNLCKIPLDCDNMARYIKQQKISGHSITFMTIIIAAFVRTVSEHPEINRFIANKRIYARNNISISFVVLKRTAGGEMDEAVCKIELNPDDTLYDVEQKIEGAVELSHDEQADTLTNGFAKMLLRVPGLPTLVVGLARLLDRYGILPPPIVDISPFHASMWITNMASISMTYIYHHIYNFGTTSIFLALGKTEKALQPLPGGDAGYKNQMTLGVVTDERICGGVTYAQAFGTMRKYLMDPSLLEKKPASVKTEIPLKPARDLIGKSK
ncbi:MAG: hypothetical protein IKE30_04240 [Clostridia bacterium]|nr:hypothetical protein [Clostridia bacterium]